MSHEKFSVTGFEDRVRLMARGLVARELAECSS